MVVDSFGDGARLDAHRARNFVDGFHPIHPDKREDEFFFRGDGTARESGAAAGWNYRNTEFGAELKYSCHFFGRPRKANGQGIGRVSFRPVFPVFQELVGIGGEKPDRKVRF
jgi:hypothetical protein